MSCSVDWSAWITAIAAITSTVVAYFMWRVSQKLYDLQASVEKSKEAKVNVWFNGSEILAPKVITSMSFVNMGEQPMRIRTLRLIALNGQAMKFKLIEKSEPAHYVEKYQSIVDSLPSYSQQATDIIFMPNTIYQAFIGIESGQFKIEAMYYDNTFEFIEIDTSNLGGKYILTGQGRK